MNGWPERMSVGLTLYNMSLSNQQKLMRYETEDHLIVLWSLFGPACGFGINDSKPRVVKSLKPHDNVTINAVSGSEDASDFKVIISSEGIVEI